MKKIILGSLLCANVLMAEVATITPYGGYVDYGSDLDKSYKDHAQFYGASMTYGDLSYLIEADYMHFATKYKSDYDIRDMNQDDTLLVFGKYYSNFMFRVGIHYISTNDVQLDDGYIGILTLGGYKFLEKGSKFSYGLNTYYSYYEDGHDEKSDAMNDKTKSIGILQFSPYLSYYNISGDWSNTAELKGHFEFANDYDKSDYSSFELKDTVFYKSFYTSLKYYNGEMRTGVKNGGSVVYNTLDLMKNGYEVGMGYYFTKDVSLNAKYSQNTMREYDSANTQTREFDKDNTNSVYVVSLSYSY